MYLLALNKEAYQLHGSDNMFGGALQLYQ